MRTYPLRAAVSRSRGLSALATQYRHAGAEFTHEQLFVDALRALHPEQEAEFKTGFSPILRSALATFEPKHKLGPALVLMLENTAAIDQLFPDSQIPRLVRGEPGQVQLSRRQVHSLLGHALFGNLDNVEGERTASLTFLDMMLGRGHSQVAQERIKCLFSYFVHAAQFSESQWEEHVVFRRCVSEKRTTAQHLEHWRGSTKPVNAHVDISSERTIEGSAGDMHVDFANKFIHIFRVIPSATQEEVLFSFRSECFPSIVLCDVMDAHEAIVIEGAVRHAKYLGYLDTFRYDGMFTDEERPPPDIVAIDAVINMNNTQFTEDMLVRDLEKCLIGFTQARGNRLISTGKWGCGAFGGDEYLKFVQQLLVASECNVSLDYSAFKDPRHARALEMLYRKILDSKSTIGQIFSIVLIVAERCLRDRRTTFIENFVDELELAQSSDAPR